MGTILIRIIVIGDDLVSIVIRVVLLLIRVIKRTDDTTTVASNPPTIHANTIKLTIFQNFIQNLLNFNPLLIFISSSVALVVILSQRPLTICPVEMLGRCRRI